MFNLTPSRSHDILGYDYYVTSRRRPIRKGGFSVNSLNINYARGPRVLIFDHEKIAIFTRGTSRVVPSSLLFQQRRHKRCYNERIIFHDAISSI